MLLKMITSKRLLPPPPPRPPRPFFLELSAIKRMIKMMMMISSEGKPSFEKSRSSLNSPINALKIASAP